MKAKKLTNVPKQEAGDFCYHHLKLPYRDYDASRPEDFPFQPDPGIDEVIDVSNDKGDPLGFLILRKDKTVEIVDAVTGEHTEIMAAFFRSVLREAADFIFFPQVIYEM